MFRLFEWIYNANSIIPIDICPVFEGNIIVGLFLRHGKPYIPCQSLVLSAVVLNDITQSCIRNNVANMKLLQ